jgi:hypothetical protein
MAKKTRGKTKRKDLKKGKGKMVGYGGLITRLENYFGLPRGSVGPKKAGGNREGREEAVYDVADEVGTTGAQFRDGG